MVKQKESTTVSPREKNHANDGVLENGNPAQRCGFRNVDQSPCVRPFNHSGVHDCTNYEIYYNQVRRGTEV